jgi:Tfp pilus assembly protein PilF
MEPILLLFASHAIFLFFDIIRLQQIKTLLILGVLLVVLSLGTHLSDKVIKVHREVAMPNAVRLAQGTRLLKAGQVSQAIPLFTKIIELNPQDKAAHYSLGIAYQKLGNEELAQKEFERAQIEAGDP